MNNNFGITLKTCRESANLTQEKLAEIVGVSSEMISRWENGHDTPKEDNVDILVDMFGDQLGVEYLKSKSKIAMRCLSGISYKPKTPRETAYLQSITANKDKESAEMLSAILLNEEIDDEEIEPAYNCIKLMEESISQQLENYAYFKDMFVKKVRNENWLKKNPDVKSALFEKFGN